jgi:transcription elongation GreA/GreB family factor/very-short-patch-repair endonuclease
MELSEKLLTELQRRLKIGNRRGVHLNAIPANSRYKFDLNRLSHIDKKLPDNFVKELLTELPLKFRISWKDNVPDLNSLFEEDQAQLVKITKAFENLINQTEAIESEKGINTFGFGFPILARRDQADNKLTVAPILIWSLRIKRTKEFNTWEILRNEDDPIYINEVLINHLQNDASIEIEQVPSNMLDDGLINKDELVEICANLIRAVNATSPDDLEETFRKKLDKITAIGDKAHYDKLPLNSSNSFIDFGGLFSIFEVQKQNIINDYTNLMELEGLTIALDDLDGHSFQPISSVETDPSQQSILHAMEATRNIVIQGPPGTGKSQTLTAVLVNALENNKKAIVVCEKRTALEVLHNALLEKGLNYHCVLVRDIVKDRKTVVDSVRDRVDNAEYKHYRYNYSKESLDNLVKRAKDLIASINRKHQKLDKKILGNKSWPDVVGDLLAELKSNTEADSNLALEKNLFTYTTQEFSDLLEFVQRGQAFYKDYAPFESTSFINPTKLVGDNPYIIEQNINDDFTIYAKQLAQIQVLKEEIRGAFLVLRKQELTDQLAAIEKCFNGITEKEAELSSIIMTTKTSYTKSRQEELTHQLENTAEIIKEIDAVFNSHQNNPDLTNEARLNSFSYKLVAAFSKTRRQVIADHAALVIYFSKLENCLEESRDLPLAVFAGVLAEKKNLLEELTKEIKKLETTFDSKVEKEFNAFQLDEILSTEDPAQIFSAMEKAVKGPAIEGNISVQLQSILYLFKGYLEEINGCYQTLVKELAGNKDIKLSYAFDESLPRNKNLLEEIKEKIGRLTNEFESKVEAEFKETDFLKPSNLPITSIAELQRKYTFLKEQIGFDGWVTVDVKGDDLAKFKSNVASLIKEKNDYFENGHDAFLSEFMWFQFYNSLSVTYKTIVNELKKKADWKKILLIHYFNSLLINTASVDLPTSDDEHRELDSALGGIEKEQLKFIKQFWFSRQIDTTREFEQQNINLSVENLYNKRSSNRYKRLSLRQIVQYDANLFTTFFPIILTSPDVASNLFKGMNGYFDIVMFDEASQLRLEDNLPAILKGKQIIIAGDEHQMPPSNYFSKVFDGSVEDEDELEEENKIVVDKDNILLSCESLLDFGTELNFQRKHLDFHYRSRHPFLIDFSNYAFYNQRLKPLPNNFDYVPIKYIQVNGTFSDHTNEAEAEMVLSIIERNINRLPSGEYPSVGIATFNITQRNLIKSKILERQKFSKYDAFNTKIKELEEKGMFIKNLENIQGDERDVIILSTTYGIGKDRKFAQRFGPLNYAKGYKLLNVIITRAKFKVYCCTSIPEQVFMNYQEYLVTEGANNKRAVLYAYIAYCKAVSESNQGLRLSVLTNLAENTTKSASFDVFRGGELESPFEEEVYQSLADHLGTEKLIPQFQFAGFRIDIVYDPKMAGVPKIAIECDGAKYHSSREAYLYDSHRQKILQNHGFVFHRIWSTNWWRNVSKETARLVEFIRKVESLPSVNSTDHTPTAFAFTDDIAILEDYVAQGSFVDLDKDDETIRGLDKELPAPEKNTGKEVRLNSTVKVKYVNNGKDITIQLVEAENNKHDKASTVQKVYYKSPLAGSLLGHSVGDIVKIGDLDNFVEIINIAN